MTWLNDLKDDGGGEPPDGTHTASLVRAVLRESKSTGAPMVITEWQTEDFAYYWTSFHNVTGGQKQFARDMLKALGLDLAAIDTEDQLGDALAAVEGRAYVVAVSHSGTFLNTRVIERATGVQTALPVEVPPAKPRSAIFDDDDIPF